MKKYVVIALVITVLIVISRTTKKGRHLTNHIKGTITNIIAARDYINKEGDSISTRVALPEGYKRKEYARGSFQEYLRNYQLKEHGAPIINYDNSRYFAQHWHDAILEVPVPENGLQQCADALMRLRSEYLWEKNRKDEIGFNFTSGHYCSWKKYAEGFRPKINGNKVSFHKTASTNFSEANFYKYLNLIFTYAGTLSLSTELPRIKVKDLQIGDMLVKPGTPGHIEIIVDHAVSSNGDHLFLLAQGNTPAQNVCLLKNFEDTSISPWYRFKENESVYTPSYYFETPIFIRFK
ncbi:DUF4846 domain-containing protein [Aquimarina litoralis]|uniref:DUF4846 domain-containing protein n=1 Tax=Aquimarina litoralis TaxID=584605 RepID=UPI001C56B69F|nr:DUF4846 domain-containing protein [Aquimarina litoralis]MBW1294271.1 hypothetical protein [Aquimarina litoralis]